MDMNSPRSMERHVPEFKNAILSTQDCHDHLYCGLPYLVPVLNMIWKTHWLPAPKPPIAIPLQMEVLSREKTKFGERVSFKVSGKI